MGARDDLPVELGLPPWVARRAEREAMARAEEWVSVDPFYEGEPLTARERALMMLALRCITEPTATDIAMVGRGREASGSDG